MLGHFRSKNIPLGLATSTYRWEFKKKMKSKPELESMFDVTVCGDEVGGCSRKKLSSVV